MTAQRAKARQRANLSAGKRPAKSGLDGVQDPVELATLTLQAICRDLSAPASARAQASRTLLELHGALRSDAHVRVLDAPASELSSEELDARIAALNSPV
jgi:hypothetical protein